MFLIKDVGRLAIKSRRAMLAIQKPVKKVAILVRVVYTVKIHVPIGIVEKSRVSPKKTNPYFPFLNKVRRPKSRVKI